MSGLSLVQRSPTKCGVSECDNESSIMRRPWPSRGLLCHGKENKGEKKIPHVVNKFPAIYGN